MRFQLLKNAAPLKDATILILLAFGFQLSVLIRFSQGPDFLPDGDDMQFYSDWGQRIASGQWTDGKAFYGLPGYAFLLGAIYRLLGFDPFAVGFLQAILFALVAGTLFDLAGLSFSGPHATSPSARWIGWLAGLGWIFFTPAQTFSTILMPTVWVVLAYWGCLRWLLRLDRPTSIRPWLLVGTFLGIVSMGVATILLLCPLILLTIWKKVAPDRPWPERGPRVALASLSLILGIYAGSAPASLHNRLIAHEAVTLSAHSGINFWIGNNPAATGYPKMPPGFRASQSDLLKDSIQLAESAAGHPLARTEVSKFWTAKADQYIRQQPMDWLRLMGRKFANFWNAYQYDDLTIINVLQEQGMIWPGLRFGIVAALGLAGLLVAIWSFPRSRWIAGAIALHLLALMPVFITERYRLAAVPGLLLFGAWWIVTLANHLAQRSWLKASVLFGTAGLTTLWVSTPRPDPSLWSLDHYKAGIHAIKAGDFPRARSHLASAFAYTPTNPDINFALGNLALEEKNFLRAQTFYLRTIALDPRHDRALNNLGILALETKSWDQAERYFSATVQLEPEDPNAHYLLARAHFGKGDHPGALQAISRALSLHPGQPKYLELKSQLERP